MPIIIKNEEKNYLQETTGLKIESLTDSQKLESPVMVVNRLIFDSNIIGPELTHTDIDQLLYVIKGNGIAKVNNEEFSLNKESILWLENGEKYQFISGGNGLEIPSQYVTVTLEYTLPVHTVLRSSLLHYSYIHQIRSSCTAGATPFAPSKF